MSLYWSTSREYYTWMWYLRHPLRFLRDLKQDISAFYHRGRYGYSLLDRWNLNTYLCSWLPSALREMRDNSIGYPPDSTPEEWEEILTRMADGFEKFQQMWEMKIPMPSDEEYERMLEDIALLTDRKCFPHLWD